MKSHADVLPPLTKQSLPVRGAWVEIEAVGVLDGVEAGRSPCGERGLKSIVPSAEDLAAMSLPVRGAWVEIRL